MSGQIKHYKSIDMVCNIENTVHYPQEFLNYLSPSGLPPHDLILKVGIPIMLSRNLSPSNICNGTMLLIRELRENWRLYSQGQQWDNCLIFREYPTDLPIPFKRLQYPVKISFAITINKSQGQTFSMVGIDLREQCFSHGIIRYQSFMFVNITLLGNVAIYIIYV